MQPVMGFPHKLMVHVNYTPIGPSPIRLLLQTHGTCQLYPHWAIPFRLLLQTHGTCQLYPHWATPLQAIITNSWYMSMIPPLGHPPSGYYYKLMVHVNYTPFRLLLPHICLTPVGRA
jgi:hypothetical protein